VVGQTVTSGYLEMNGITKSFSGVEVLHSVNLSVQPGEVHALVGENGAGKSTLMKILCGDLQPDGGSIRLGDARATFRSPLDAERAGISMIQQELSYIGALSVAENLSLGHLPKRSLGIVNWTELRARAQAQVQAVGVTIDPGRRMDSLSSSERQLVEILRALNRNARLVIMDEPTSSLTGPEVQLLFELIARVRSNGVAVIYISHHLDEIFSVADRVTVLRDGRRVSTTEVAATSHDELVRDMVGGNVELGRSGSRSVIGEVLCSVRDLTVSNAVRGVDLDLRRGEIYALYGLVGAGQERVARALYGLEPDYEGVILLDGRSVHLHSPAQAMAVGIGFVPADRKLEGIVPRRGVRENLTYPSLRDLSRLGLLRLRKEASLASKAIDRLRIKATAGQPLESLSGGNQQKVVVSRWFARAVRLLVLTDPTRGVDVRAKSEIHRFVRELAATGVAVLLVSGDLPEVVSLADRIGVIRRGSLVAELDGRTTSAEEVLTIAAGGGVT
jgi:ABC-type sugar transport system ATPase subunit